MSENKENENKIEIKPVHWVYIIFGIAGLVVVLAVLFMDDGTQQKNPLMTSSTENIPATFEGIDQHISERGIGTKIDIPGIRTRYASKAKKVIDKDAIIDSLRKANLALHEANKKLKKTLISKPVKKLAKKPAKKKVVAQKYVNIENYWKKANQKKHSASQKKPHSKINESPWVRLKFLDGLTIFQSSRVSLETQEDIILAAREIPRGAFVEGICNLSRDRLFIDFYKVTTENDQIEIKGNAYQLIDKSLGVRVVIKKGNAEEEFLSSLSGKAADIIHKIDPSRAIRKSRNSQEKRESESYTKISDDTMILARITSVERN